MPGGGTEKTVYVGFGICDKAGKVGDRCGPGKGQKAVAKGMRYKNGSGSRTMMFGSGRAKKCDRRWGGVVR